MKLKQAFKKIILKTEKGTSRFFVRSMNRQSIENKSIIKNDRYAF